MEGERSLLCVSMRVLRARMWGLRRDTSGLSIKVCLVFSNEIIFFIFFSPCSNIYHSGSRLSKLLWLPSGATDCSIFIFFVQNTLSL